MPDKIYKNYLVIVIFVIWSLVLAAKFAPAGIDFTFGIAAYVVSALAACSLYVIKYIKEETIKLSMDLTLLFYVTSSPLSLFLLGYFYEQQVSPFFK
ncbi:MAG TPA: hypothetical protein VGC76_05755 [Pyrinomonadaceae bacterium]|jgi:hypothetical protein